MTLIKHTFSKRFLMISPCLLMDIIFIKCLFWKTSKPSWAILIWSEFSSFLSARRNFCHNMVMSLLMFPLTRSLLTLIYQLSPLLTSLASTSRVWMIIRMITCTSNRTRFSFLIPFLSSWIKTPQRKSKKK